MLHINLQGEAIKSSHCESGPSLLPDQHTVAMLYEAELLMSLLEKRKQTENSFVWPGKIQSAV